MDSRPRFVLPFLVQGRQGCRLTGTQGCVRYVANFSIPGNRNGRLCLFFLPLPKGSAYFAAFMANIPLEDSFADIIGKAQRGLKLPDEVLASKSGVPLETLVKVKAGEVDEEALPKLAAVLDLGADALLALARKAWFP